MSGLFGLGSKSKTNKKPVKTEEVVLSPEDQIRAKISKLENLRCGLLEFEQASAEGYKEEMKNLYIELATLQAARFDSKPVDISFLKELDKEGLPAYVAVEPRDSCFSLLVRPRNAAGVIPIGRTKAANKIVKYKDIMLGHNYDLRETIKNYFQEAAGNLVNIAVTKYKWGATAIDARFSEGVIPQDLRKKMDQAYRLGFDVFVVAKVDCPWKINETITIHPEKIKVVASKYDTAFLIGEYSPIPIRDYLQSKLNS